MSPTATRDRENTPATPWRSGHPAAPLITRFELYEDLAAGGSAQAFHVFQRGGSHGTLSDINKITVHSIIGGYHGSTGERWWAQWYPDSQKWEAFPSGPGAGGTKIVRFNAHANADTSVSCTEYTGTPGSETAGATISAWNKAPGIMLYNGWGTITQINGNWYVSRPDGTFHTGIADVNLSKGSAPGNVSIYDGLGGDTGFNVLSYSDLGDVTAGDKCHVHNNGVIWIVTAKECVTP